MQQFIVTKLIDFCYGHRLLEYHGKCKHLHGHNGRLEVDIMSTELDSLGMVIDFNEVRDQVKQWIDHHLDHRMILCRRDPFVPLLQEMGEPIYLLDVNPTAENIAKEIFCSVRKLGLTVAEVRLWETVSSCATYRNGATGR